eukprot:175176_1
MRSTSIIHSIAILASFSITGVQAFAPSLALSSPCRRAETTIFATDDAPTDPQEVIGKTIKVVGDVNGGYVRTCIKNEVRKVKVCVPHFESIAVVQYSMIIYDIHHLNFPHQYRRPTSAD